VLKIKPDKSFFSNPSKLTSLGGLLLENNFTSSQFACQGNCIKATIRGFRVRQVMQISFYPINDIQARLDPRFVPRLVDPLNIQGLEEALYRRIVPGNGAPAYRNSHAEGCGQF
jgi:hypothetical protein